jgi:DnaK suppressor protein
VVLSDDAVSCTVRRVPAAPRPEPASEPAHADELVASLETLRGDLERSAAALRAGADVPSGGISFGKRVGEGTNIAIERFADVAIHDQIVHQLAAVEAALTRVTEGTYGVCEVCRRPIAAERLEAIPWAATCVACA